jgi:hypothetical protein
MKPVNRSGRHRAAVQKANKRSKMVKGFVSFLKVRDGKAPSCGMAKRRWLRAGLD